MKQYIKWIIDNEEDIRKYVREKMKELQKATQNNDIHGRTNEAVNVMTLGFNICLKFLHSYNIISAEQQKALEEVCYITLFDVANRQAQAIDDFNPVNMFINALEQLYTTKRIYLKDYNNCSKTEYDNTSLIGYVDNKENDGDGLYYLFPDITYNLIIQFYKQQDIKFPISKSALWKYLDMEGYLYKTPKMQRRTVRRKIPNTENEIAFIPILQEKMKNIYLKPRYDSID